ncbi:MAG: sensor histidine kinase [Agrococcus casei]|uniref:sensor histidine kinase n=1 Tax=Agrococcus casei TaxID=343512 RepID=UPI003F9ABF7B
MSTTDVDATSAGSPVESPEPDARGPWERFGWLMAVIWMIFLIYPIIALVASTAPLAWRVVAWAALAAFALAYITGFVLGMRSGWGRVARPVAVIFPLLILFAAATSPAIGWSALGFLPFVMSYASYGMRGWWHWATSIASVVIVTAVLIGFGGHPAVLPIFVIVVILSVVNSVNVWLISRSIRSEQLRVDLATSHERETISRDVHDLIGHSLTVVKLKAELAAKLVDRDPERAKRELAEIAELTGEAITGVRSTVTGLRASGLAEQLGASRAAIELAGLEFEVDGGVEAMSPAQSLTASWILREATTNILRHAAASKARVAFTPGTMLVDDNGVGIGDRPPSPSSNGMRSMVERASAAGATLTVGEAPHGGTRVQLQW